MPIYEYECKACAHKFERIQKFSDEPLKDCPDCAKPELTKLVSAAAFRLKGGGWYETDFKSGSKKNVLHGASDSGSADGGGAGSGDGGKPAESTKSSDSGTGGSSDSTSSSKSGSGKKGDTSAAAT